MIGSQNPLGPAGQQDVPAPQVSPRSNRSVFHQAHDYHRAVYEKVMKAGNMLDHVRRELDQLVTKGDMVTHDEVMGAAGRLVGHGIPAKDMAALLATMPAQAGQALGAWLQQQDQAVTQQEGAVLQARGQAQHQMGVSAFRELAADHVQQAMGQQTASAAASGGQLAPTPNGADEQGGNV